MHPYREGVTRRTIKQLRNTFASHGAGIADLLDTASVQLFHGDGVRVYQEAYVGAPVQHCQEDRYYGGTQHYVVQFVFVTISHCNEVHVTRFMSRGSCHEVRVIT